MEKVVKRLVFCFDGTWNEIDRGDATNVAKIAQAVSLADEGVAQIVHYDEGVGTFDFEGDLSAIANQLSGAFGWGLQQNIIEAYTFLILNYQPGDEIYVFGFSRGAFTARSFCGLLRNVGVVDRRHLPNLREAIDLYISRDADASPDTDYCRKFRYDRQNGVCLARDRDWIERNYPEEQHHQKIDLTVKFLGVWDTVGALGLPVPKAVEELVNKEYGFHDTRLSTFVERARHAVAADEERRTFTPTLWSNIDDLRTEYGDCYDEKIFPGTHGSVGGGGPVVGLSDAALEWVYRGAEAAGLKFDTDAGSPLFRLQPNHQASLHNVTDKHDFNLKDWLMGVGTETREFPNLTADDVHQSTIDRFNDERMKNTSDGEYRPKSLESIFEDLKNRRTEVKGVLDEEHFDFIDSEGLLKLPTDVRTHKIQPNDSLRAISRKYYKTYEKDDLIFAYNLQIGRLHNKNKLYVGREIKIPFYA